MRLSVAAFKLPTDLDRYDGGALKCDQFKHCTDQDTKNLRREAMGFKPVQQRAQQHHGFTGALLCGSLFIARWMQHFQRHANVAFISILSHFRVFAACTKATNVSTL